MADEWWRAGPPLREEDHKPGVGFRGVQALGTQGGIPGMIWHRDWQWEAGLSVGRIRARVGGACIPARKRWVQSRGTVSIVNHAFPAASRSRASAEWSCLLMDCHACSARRQASRKLEMKLKRWQKCF